MDCGGAYIKLLSKTDKIELVGISFSSVSFLLYIAFCSKLTTYDQGPVVQSIVSLTSSLRVISLNVLADSIHNILIFFAEKM